MTTENAIELVKKYAQPAKSSFGGELDYKIIPSKQFYHLANDIAEKINTSQNEAIILRSIIAKILNEKLMMFTVEEQEKIEKITDEHLNEE